MRLIREWRIASLLSALLLLSGGNVCMVVTCAQSAARERAPQAAHHCCSQTGAAQPGQHPRGTSDNALPCNMAVTLAHGPEIQSPAPILGSLAVVAALARPLDETPESRISIGPAPPGHSHSPPPPLFLDASGVRAPPIA